MKRTVYLDNAATTPCDPLVIEKMIPYFTKEFWNPSASYEPSYIIKSLIEDSQQKISKLINCNPKEIYFTSGGSESDNWALRGIVKSGDHIITSKIEHHAILHTCKYLESCGVDVSYIDVDEIGVINLEQLESSIKPNTRLVSVMYANNEVGSIQPILEICSIAHRHGVLFHTDATQIVGHELIDVKGYGGIDLLTASAHKLNGPKGVGFLYIRDGIEISPLIYGGAQQNGIRAGTVNVPGIIGFGKAAEIANNWEYRYLYCTKLRNYFEDKIIKAIPHVKINGDRYMRLSNITSASFKGIRAEALLVMLEMHGIYVSTGSACNSSSGEPSHVLISMGLSEEEADSTIRFSLSHLTTKDDIDYVIDVLCQCVSQLRAVNKQ